MIKLDLPEFYFGFPVHIGTYTGRGKRLISWILDNGDYSGLVFAGLVKELDVKWWRGKSGWAGISRRD